MRTLRFLAALPGAVVRDTWSGLIDLIDRWDTAAADAINGDDDA